MLKGSSIKSSYRKKTDKKENNQNISLRVTYAQRQKLRAFEKSYDK